MNNKELPEQQIKLSIKDFATLIPLFAFSIYILGYVIINGYLSQFSLINDELINTSFLKAGILFLLLLIPILVIIFLNYEQPTDNFLKAKKYYPHLLINILSYLTWMTIFILDYKKLKLWEILAFFMGNCIDFLIYFFATSLLMKNVRYKVKVAIQLIIPIIFLIYFSIRFLHLFILYSSIFLICQYFIGYLGIIADKKYSWGHTIGYLLWIILMAYSFGFSVYGNLPAYLSGSSPIEVEIIAKSDNTRYLNSIGLGFNDNHYSQKLLLLYNSSDKYLLKKDDKVFYISKDLFQGFISKQDNGIYIFNRSNKVDSTKK